MARRRRAGAYVFAGNGTSNGAEVNGWLSTIGSIDGDNDFCLSRNALRRTSLRQSGRPDVSKRGESRFAVQKICSPGLAGPDQVRDISSGGATLSGSGLT
jgi:hypothetical protein